MNHIDNTLLDWEKMNNLIPAIIQHANNGDILMLGYMDPQALEITQVTRKLTLYSRSKQRIWRKGESSGNSMDVISLAVDCDGDSLLVQVIPTGPACHLGYSSCYKPVTTAKINFLACLADIIQTRGDQQEGISYTAQLVQSGVPRCAQKVGEEAVETVIAAVEGHKDAVIEETADLLFHVLVLLKACELDLYQVIDCLQQRHMPIVQQK
ncbi:histidine biosynthesis bifunctional protein HisIE [Legionella quinlivanii]|uniref:Histidine biosynthesis bifunctional protein HisIE n=1 Tax=Legionella quinlivanii TaxID=45073 RepID=A0A0W0Y4X1_9GAMM|nr:MULTISPECIES: bifunctional phosphoribosyl-AMP cyclohydrolase/phosphoribosyl-ATP diphosphatase HisIE [Legionella]KTD51711.1 histidine biosynthesis bifunctional protein HisIE [Legionella quinlivanii]MCE3044870.1 bifunctional phosphoribosyl-AMP cyclohydrolase/phosphoribosyl-ATP diphosphatase HisIE [Legionella sp. 16cNR16C]MCW8451048.1 bifunctional phosphoribosyl-AMP cyclohydrolase/phosphoribosyl-ATP diphosphatase HisIE [Legionella quinlivanii]SEF63823.1 phosphoribosyl-ATP pyrophosphatase /phosp